MTAPATFKQSDVTRAAKGVVAAGLDVVRVEIQGGKIVVYTAFDDAFEVSKTGWEDIEA